MRKLLLLFMVLGLGFSACQKDEASADEAGSGETFILNGEVFNVEDVKTKFAYIGGLNRDHLTWVPDSLGFTRLTYGDYIYKVEPIIDIIKQVDSWGK